MPIKVRTNSGGLTAGTNIPGNGSPSFSSTPLTHKDLDNNFKSVWPVGSVYFNIGTDRNPRALLGFGTWQAFGQKTVLVGKNDSPWSGAGDPSQFSRKITGAKPVTSSINSRLVLTFSQGNSPFSVGQKVTINGLSASNARVNLNRERKILKIGDENGNSKTTKITVDYTSPSSDVTNNNGILGTNETITIASNARATLFGTLYNDVSPNMLKGQGGEFSHNVTREEVPSHTHTAPLVEDGNSKGRRTQDVPYTHRAAAPDGGVDNIKLSGRAHGGGDTNRDSLNSTMRGFAHENTMPFITCYMWLRVY